MKSSFFTKVLSFLLTAAMLFTMCSVAASAEGSGGYFALAAIGGLALGILGTALVMSKGRKKKEETT